MKPVVASGASIQGLRLVSEQQERLESSYPRAASAESASAGEHAVGRKVSCLVP